jgi:hypothetical protein
MPPFLSQWGNVSWSLDLQVSRLRVVRTLLDTAWGGSRCIFLCDHAPAIGNPAAQSLDHIMFRSKESQNNFSVFCLFKAIVTSRRQCSFGEWLSRGWPLHLLRNRLQRVTFMPHTELFISNAIASSTCSNPGRGRDHPDRGFSRFSSGPSRKF